MRGGALLAVLLAAGCAAVEPEPALGLRCGAPCARILGSSNAAAEGVIASDARDPRHLVEANLERTSTGGWIVTRTSRDGGATWTEELFGGGPPSEPGFEHVLLDADAAILPDGDAVFTGLTYRRASAPRAPAQDYAVLAVRADLGATHGAPGVVATRPVSLAATDFVNVEDVDHPRLTVGADGTLLLTITLWRAVAEAPPGGPRLDLLFATSSDGRVWSPAQGLRDGLAFGFPAVAPDGTLHVLAMQPALDDLAKALGDTPWEIPLVLATSGDAGATWRFQDTGIRAAWWPTLHARGTELFAVVAVAAGEGREQPILARSVDGGRTWSSLALDEPDAPGHTIPTFAVLPSGDVVVAFHHAKGDGTSADYRAVVVRGDRVSAPLVLEPETGTVRGLPPPIREYGGAAPLPDGAALTWGTMRGDGTHIGFAIVRIVE